MRKNMSRFTQFLATRMPFFTVTTVSAVILVTFFQNCGSYEIGSSNPLYDSNLSSSCLGINCERDLNTAKIRAGFSAYTIERATVVNSAICDASQCIDIGGYCETGGYPNSVFYVQWLLAGASGGTETRTTSNCDSNGRFHVQIHVPPGYNWLLINHLRVYMKVIDEKNLEFSSPSGGGEFIYQVSTRVGS